MGKTKMAKTSTEGEETVSTHFKIFHDAQQLFVTMNYAGENTIRIEIQDIFVNSFVGKIILTDNHIIKSFQQTMTMGEIVKNLINTMEKDHTVIKLKMEKDGQSMLFGINIPMGFVSINLDTKLIKKKQKTDEQITEIRRRIFNIEAQQSTLNEFDIRKNQPMFVSHKKMNDVLEKLLGGQKHQQSLNLLYGSAYLSTGKEDDFIDGEFNDLLPSWYPIPFPTYHFTGTKNGKLRMSLNMVLVSNKVFSLKDKTSIKIYTEGFPVTLNAVGMYPIIVEDNGWKHLYKQGTTSESVSDTINLCITVSIRSGVIELMPTKMPHDEMTKRDAFINARNTFVYQEGYPGLHKNYSLYNRFHGNRTDLPCNMLALIGYDMIVIK
jgi:hypothetical protein